MEYLILKFVHIVGLSLMTGGLIAVWLSDLRSRQLLELRLFSECIRNIAIFYDGLVVPGAVLLFISGAWLTATMYGGWNFIHIPWLAGMLGLFIFEFIEGNTITRLSFMKMRRLSREALEKGQVTKELREARADNLPTFTHFLDIPIIVVIIMLGTIRPTTWMPFFIGLIMSLVIATILTIVITRIYPWVPEKTDVTE
jgi:uncharacterized membrane protein